MLVIRTGLPGHSKTLNAIKEVDAESASSNRPVYYHNIPDLAIDKLKGTWFEFEDPKEWYKLPHNSIIIIDEAQGWFGTRDARQPMPPHYSEFETHRHKGFDVHLITQHGMFLDTHIRRLAGKHVYFFRLWNGKRVSRYEFEKFTDTDKKSETKFGKRTIIKLDKTYFGLYKSAVAHNMKFRPPLVVVCLPILIIGLAIAIPYMTNRQPAFLGKTPIEANGQTADRPATARKSEGPVYEPRVPGLPASAPLYDGLTVPLITPKLTCFYSEDQDYNRSNPSGFDVLVSAGSSVACGCFTQQGTKYSVTFELCKTYALHGSFDNIPSASGRASIRASLLK